MFIHYFNENKLPKRRENTSIEIEQLVTCVEMVYTGKTKHQKPNTNRNVICMYVRGLHKQFCF